MYSSSHILHIPTRKWKKTVINKSLQIYNNKNQTNKRKRKKGSENQFMWQRSLEGSFVKASENPICGQQSPPLSSSSSLSTIYIINTTTTHHLCRSYHRHRLSPSPSTDLWFHSSDRREIEEDDRRLRNWNGGERRNSCRENSEREEREHGDGGKNTFQEQNSSNTKL